MNYFSLDKKKDRGFSLIELVVVVGVLAVLSAIAIPSFVCFPKKTLDNLSGWYYNIY